MMRLPSLKRRHLPTLSAAAGLLIGLLLAAFIDKSLLGDYLPIPIFQDKNGIRVLLRVFGKEALPLALASILSLTVRHPLPILLENAWRALLFALSSCYLAAQGKPLILWIYLLLHLAALLSHIAAGIATLDFKKEIGCFPILYFIGLLFLLTIIRLLAFTLLL